MYGMIVLRKVAKRAQDGDAPEDCTGIPVGRAEMDRRRMRKQAADGTDVGIELDSGERLHHGDLLRDAQKYFVIEQMPEKVARIKMPDDSAESCVLLGHIIGNRHRPISMRDGLVRFPIQDESELETFGAMLKGISKDIEIDSAIEIFEPHEGADVHEHA